MLKIGNRVLISRSPIDNEDPDQVWIDEFEEMVGSTGTVVEDTCPYALDSIYALIQVDDYSDFFLPIPILSFSDD